MVLWTIHCRYQSGWIRWISMSVNLVINSPRRASGRTFFFINNGNNTFTESAAKMGLDDDGYDVQAAFLDYDKDGDLDMYLMRNAFVNYNRNNARDIRKDTVELSATAGKLYKNNGNLNFSDAFYRSPDQG